MAASTSTISSPDAAAAAGVKHGYFSQPSNTHASRLLSNPNWRESNTATSESFLSGYFAKSRLHHLSTWKSQMQDIVGQALREEGSGRERGSPDLPHGTQRIIMHIDFDSYFVTVGLRTRPELRGKPVVVCHSISNTVDQHQSSTSEIASCSYEARAFGVRNGMSLGQARKYCPQIQAIPYAFQEYHDTSIQLYSLLLAHADAIEAVSVDEALIDVSLLLQALLRRDTAEIEASALAARFHSHNEAANPPMPSPATALAQALREEISERTGCSASIGIGSNVLLARLATRKAKPGGVWHLRPSVILDFTAGLDVNARGKQINLSVMVRAPDAPADFTAAAQADPVPTRSQLSHISSFSAATPSRPSSYCLSRRDGRCCCRRYHHSHSLSMVRAHLHSHWEPTPPPPPPSLRRSVSFTSKLPIICIPAAAILRVVRSAGTLAAAAIAASQVSSARY
ncbi:hypothetical protein V8E36_008434 [Tilletia maclaganii]